MKATLFLGIVLLAATPGFSHFVKAALGFRLGYSPTEGHATKGPIKKAVGVQLLTGLNNGGWNPLGFSAVSGPGRDIRVAASNQIPQIQVAQARSATPLDSQVGNSGVRHFRILGMNLYLGGRASHLGQPSLLKPVAQASAKSNPQASASGLPFIGQQPYQAHHPQQISPLQAFANPLQLGAGIGAGLKPIVAQGPNGGKIIGGLGGIRGSVGVPGYGVGFNLGYRQGVNTKSPLGSLFGLGSGGLLSGLGFGRPHAASVHHPAAIHHHHKGHDQAYFGAPQLLKGHGHEANALQHASVHGGPGPIGGHNAFAGFPQALETPIVTGLESKHQITSQLPTGGDKAATLQLQGQQSQQQAQKHRGLQGPFALPSNNRPSILSLFRPSTIFRSNPLKYTFNNPQSLPSGPIRMVMSPHPPTPAPQRPHPLASDVPPPGWSTLYSVTGPQNSFLNPLPANGQPLSKLQASLHSQGNPQASAQHQIPFIQPPQHQQPYHQGSYQGPYSSSFGGHSGYTGGLFSSRPFHQPTSPRPSSNPFRNFFASFQRPAAAAPQHQQQQQQAQHDFGQYYYQPQQSHAHQSPIRHQSQGGPQQYSPFQSFAPFSYNPSPQFSPGRPPYLSQIQEQPLHAAPTAPSAKVEYPHMDPNVPFTADSLRFEPPQGYTYSHSTHSRPVAMNSYTMDMIVNGPAAPGGSGSSEQSTSSSDTPMFGPMGRRIKKAKKVSRADVIIKKQDTNADEPSSVRPSKPNQSQDMMEASASNSITMASSLGSTSWTPMVVVNPPVLTRKSLETPEAVSTKKAEPKSIIKQLPLKQLPIKPSPVIDAPQEVNGERHMILKRRRLSASGEVFTSPAAVTSSSAPTTVAATTTTTVVPPSTSSAPTTSSPSVTTVVSA